MRQVAPRLAVASTFLTSAAVILSHSRRSRTLAFCLYPSFSLYLPPLFCLPSERWRDPPAGGLAAVDRHAILTTDAALQGGLSPCHGAAACGLTLATVSKVVGGQSKHGR